MQAVEPDLSTLSWDLLDPSTVKHFAGIPSMVNWPHVQWTANHFWSCQGTSPEELEARQVAWHHLLMTAGNFKRQAPITMGNLPDGERKFSIGAHRSDSFDVEVDGETLTVFRSEPTSWEVLDRIPGVAVATATTVLSALWPGDHVIADRRDLGAAIGLAYDEAKGAGLVKTNGYDGEVVSWKRYQWFLPKVTDKAKEIGIEPVVVERALFQIDLETGTKANTPWEQYRRQLWKVLQH